MEALHNSVGKRVGLWLQMAFWPQSLLGRLLAVVCYVVIVGNIAALTVLYNQAAANVERTERVRLRSIVVPLAQQIDGDMHEAIARRYVERGEVANWNLGTEELQYVHHQLKAVADQLHIGDPIVTLRMRPDRVKKVYSDYKSMHPGAYEVMMSSEVEPKWREPRAYTPRMARAQFARMISSSGIYADERGRWISAYAPIIDSNDDVVAVLEVRASIEHLFEEVRLQSMQQGSLIAVIMLTMILGIAYVTAKLGRDLYAIERAAEQLGKGNLTQQVQISGGAEVRRLAHSMELARRRLQKNAVIIDNVKKGFEQRLGLVMVGFDFAGNARRKRIATDLSEMSFALEVGSAKPVRAFVMDLLGPRWSFKVPDPSATLWRQGMEVDIRIAATLRRPEVYLNSRIDSVYTHEGTILVHVVLNEVRFEDFLSPAVVRLLDRRENFRVREVPGDGLRCSLLVHLTGERLEVQVADICRTGMAVLVNDSVKNITCWGPNIFATVRLPTGSPEKIPAEIRYVLPVGKQTRLGLEFDDDFLQETGIPSLLRYLMTEERVQR
jgi:hypothetical protein